MGQEENIKIYFMCYLSHAEKSKERFPILRIRLTQNLHLACVCVTFSMRGISQKKWEGHDSECLFIDSTLISSHNGSFQALLG